MADLANSGTDSQTLTASLDTNTLTIAISDGNTQTVNLASLNTDAQDIASLAFDSSTNSLTVGITGGTSQTISLADLANSGTDSQTLAQVTAQGSSTTDIAIQVGGIFDNGLLVVSGESSLQGDVNLGQHRCIFRYDFFQWSSRYKMFFFDATGKDQTLTASLNTNTLTIAISDGNTHLR